MAWQEHIQMGIEKICHLLLFVAFVFFVVSCFS